MDMRPYWMKMGPKSNESVCIRDRRGGHTEIPKEGHVRMESEREVGWSQAKE